MIGQFIIYNMKTTLQHYNGGLKLEAERRREMNVLR